jgi:hypothetical protein
VKIKITRKFAKSFNSSQKLAGNWNEQLDLAKKHQGQ